jgi:transketolase
LNNKIEHLQKISKEIRRLIIEVANLSKTAHVGSSLSSVDLLSVLYFNKLLINESNWETRDIFVLSKAHAALALYSTLTLKGFIARKELLGYFQDKGTLPGHLDRLKGKGVEVSTGALGHGFNIALGMAYGYKLKNDKRQVYSIIGDGESMEGSIWEGALFAPTLEVDNFTAFLDHNNLQGYGRTTELCHFEPIVDKWKAFGWETFRVNGHDFLEIIQALDAPHKGKPKMIIADTIKGKGVSFMENAMKWHYFMVSDEHKKQALRELR